MSVKFSSIGNQMGQRPMKPTTIRQYCAEHRHTMSSDDLREVTGKNWMEVAEQRAQRRTVHIIRNTMI